MIGFEDGARSARMHGFIRRLVGSLLLPLLGASAAPSFAQTRMPPVDETTISDRREYDRQQQHWHFAGRVEMERGDTTVFADDIEVWTDQDRAVATGNVVFTQGTSRLAADRAEFNTRTRLGTFYNASGIATVQPLRQPAAAPGAFAPPPLTGQDTDVYFFGDKVDKIGAKKYRISNGGFTTCLQPTPRWSLHADTVVLNIDHYAFLRQAVFDVKGVPMLYLPILYYPTQEDQRATGFLLPTYGVSSLRGQAIHNAFFWAINRSQDATILHDWFSRAGQGIGTEYRYNMGGGADGTIRSYWLDQQQIATGGGAINTDRSYELRGAMNQPLPHRFRARARVDYFSSLTTMQTFNTNIYDASRNQRTYGANVAGAWGSYALNGTFDRSELFYNGTSSSVNGSAPRVTLTRGERPLFKGSPLFLSATAEYAQLVRQDSNESLSVDKGLGRLDFAPQVRFPFKKWQWFTVNSSVAFRETHYSRSLDPRATDPSTGTPRIVDDDLNRRYFTVQSSVIGPVFNRVWNTPDSGYAERFKHTVEPFVTAARTSAVDNFDRIVVIDGTDTIVGNTTSLNYGVNNRVYAKRKIGRINQAQEILTLALSQTYYTNPKAAQFDPRYATSFSAAPPNNFSPIVLDVRAAPAAAFNASARAEVDSRYLELRTLSVNGSYNWLGRLQATAGWSQRFFIERLPGFNNPNFLDHSLNLQSNAHTQDNRLGAIYSFNYDIRRGALLQQRLAGFYNAQCCGLAFEYQTFNFGGISGFSAIPGDRRFFLSFTLAGLGNFSPFSGGLGAVPR